MPEPKIHSIIRRAGHRPDTRTAVQVDGHIHARKIVLGRRLSARPVTHRSASQIEAHVATHPTKLRMHRPEAPGS